MIKRLLVFGAAGFTGRHLTQFLTQSPGCGYEIHLADAGLPKDIPGSCIYHQLDAKDRGALHREIGSIRPDLLINLIGTFSAKSWDEYYELNVLVSKNILDSLQEHSLLETRILLVGSAAEYGNPEKCPLLETDPLNPVNLYGLSKAMQTQLSRYYSDVLGSHVIIARTFNVTGEGISPVLSVGSFARQIESAKDGDTIVVGNLETERDFLPISEAVSRYMFLLEHAEPGMVYNICSGQPKKMRSVVEDMIEKSRKKLTLEVDPSRFKKNDVQCIYGDTGRFEELKRKVGVERR